MGPHKPPVCKRSNIHPSNHTDSNDGQIPVRSHSRSMDIPGQSIRDETGRDGRRIHDRRAGDASDESYRYGGCARYRRGGCASSRRGGCANYRLADVATDRRGAVD